MAIGAAMAATRWLESRDDYGAQSSSSSASGAYQVIDSTWNNYAGYARAVHAPPHVQDQFAYESFVAILKRHGNDVSMIPLTWYYPRAINNPELMDVIPSVGANVFTPREYQRVWMDKFYELLGQGSPPYVPGNDPSEPYIRSMAFPVLGPTSYINDWGFPRDGGRRSHEGNDLMGVSGQPLRSAVDGVVTRLRYTNEGTAGVVVSITDSDGYRYNYFHLNDDTPGTTDNAAVAALRIHPALGVGTTVQAGQIIGYMGDSGNATGVPHLHFEIRDRSGTPMNPYPSLVAAQQREQCTVGIGPWSTAIGTPTSGLGWSALTSTRHVISGPAGAQWEISTSGSVRARGHGTLIAPPAGGECPVVPDGEYGTDALGVGVGLMPDGWWEVPSWRPGEFSGGWPDARREVDSGSATGGCSQDQSPWSCWRMVTDSAPDTADDDVPSVPPSTYGGDAQ